LISLGFLYFIVLILYIWQFNFNNIYILKFIINIISLKVSVYAKKKQFIIIFFYINHIILFY